MNPKYESLAGLQAYPSVAKLPATPDLAVICTPPATVPGLIKELGQSGTKAAIVLTAGLAAVKDRRGVSMKDLMLAEPDRICCAFSGRIVSGFLRPAFG